MQTILFSEYSRADEQLAAIFTKNHVTLFFQPCIQFQCSPFTFDNV